MNESYEVIHSRLTKSFQSCVQHFIDNPELLKEGQNLVQAMDCILTAVAKELAGIKD